MCSVGFRSSLVNFTKDGILDKKEIKELDQIKNQVVTADSSSPDAQIAEQAMSAFNNIQEDTNFTFTINNSDNEPVELNFLITPKYGEKEKIEAKTMDEAIALISQGDHLDETKNDNFRCTCASGLNAALRFESMKNPSKSPAQAFASIATKLGVPTEFNYENIHKAQDKLYKLANTDGEDMITSGNAYRAFEDGSLVEGSVKVSGEVTKILSKLNLSGDIMHGPDVANFEDNKDMVNKRLSSDSNASFLVPVNLDVETGAISTGGDTNHTVLVYQKEGKLYMKDTGAAENGESNVIQVDRNFIYSGGSNVIAVKAD